MNKRQAATLVAKAFTDGMEWAGVHREGRPLVGCDPNNAVASAAFNRVRTASKENPRAIEVALWNYIMKHDSCPADDLVIVEALQTRSSATRLQQGLRAGG